MVSSGDLPSDFNLASFFARPDFRVFQHRVMVGGSSRKPNRISFIIGRGGSPMDYFAGLDVSMAETQICIVARNGAVIHKAKVPSTPADIAAELAQVPSCRRIVFETG